MSIYYIKTSPPEGKCRASGGQALSSRCSSKQLNIIQGCFHKIGLTNSEIANQLGITYDGVKAHLKVIFAKLGVTDRTEAITIALRKHLLKI